MRGGVRRLRPEDNEARRGAEVDRKEPGEKGAGEPGGPGGPECARQMEWAPEAV